MSKFTITAGHGSKFPVGFDPGALGYGFTEPGLMVSLRNIVAKKLREGGHSVATDGDGLVNLPLSSAISLIAGAKLGVELHMNASTNYQATGVEAISLPRLKPVAQKLAQAVAKVLEIPIRADAGWKPMQDTPHGRLGFVSAGGIILETCFISNRGDLEALRQKEWLVASAIVGVLENA